MYLEEYNGVESPYNTYKVTGLPPGRMCSPGLKSIQAVLAPAAHDYLFFVAEPGGTGCHAFGGFRLGFEEIILWRAHAEVTGCLAGAVDQAFSQRRGDANGHILDDAAKTAHRMALEVGQANDKVVVGEMRAHYVFLEVFISRLTGAALELVSTGLAYQISVSTDVRRLQHSCSPKTKGLLTHYI